MPETKDFGSERMAAQEANDADEYSGYRDNERNVPNSTGKNARQHNCRESAKKKDSMNLKIDNSTRESGDGTTTGELLTTKIPEPVPSNAGGLSYSDNDSWFVPIAASEQHASGCAVKGLLEISKCIRK